MTSYLMDIQVVVLQGYSKAKSDIIRWKSASKGPISKNG